MIIKLLKEYGATDFNLAMVNAAENGHIEIVKPPISFLQHTKPVIILQKKQIMVLMTFSCLILVLEFGLKLI